MASAVGFSLWEALLTFSFLNHLSFNSVFVSCLFSRIFASTIPYRQHLFHHELLASCIALGESVDFTSKFEERLSFTPTTLSLVSNFVCLQSKKCWRGKKYFTETNKDSKSSKN
ncbi:hypothetical protein V2G26_013697 [Clonostachys chloroleuca]